MYINTHIYSTQFKNLLDKLLSAFLSISILNHIAHGLNCSIFRIKSKAKDTVPQKYTVIQHIYTCRQVIELCNQSAESEYDLPANRHKVSLSTWSLTVRRRFIPSQIFITL